MNNTEKIFKNIKLLVLDFDGVMTNNKVYVDENGKETVRCDRSDGLGLEILKQNGIDVFILSKERNPVVRRRCEKLGLDCIHGVDKKIDIFKTEIEKRNLTKEQVCFVGNDINDLECIEYAGIGCAVRDSHEKVLDIADYITDANGGNGAVREVCDKILY